MQDHEDGPIEHVAEYETMPGAPTPAWTRTVIETAGGELWVAACNFWPELGRLPTLADGTIPFLTYCDERFIQLGRAMAVDDMSRLVGEAIKSSLPNATCLWRKKRPPDSL